MRRRGGGWDSDFARVVALSMLGIVLTGAQPGAGQGDARSGPAGGWPQWGGPGRDFKVGPVTLADRWPEGGPRRLWQRSLGEGYSAIVADDELLFTMYRDGDDEVLTALQAADGKTRWEHRDAAPLDPGQTTQHGKGPNATPLVLADRIVAVGFTGRMRCLRKRDGRPLWSVDLVNDLGGRVQYYGYSSSPILYRGHLIVLVGGETCGVAAFDPTDGRVRWRSEGCKTGYASPIVINVDGQDQLVFFSEDEVIGMNPTDGSRLWGHKVVNFCRTNCTDALWGDDNLLFAATKGVGGTRVLRLRQRDGKTTVEEVWRNRRMRIYHWNALRIGDRVYTSTGDTGRFLSVIDVKTGRYVMRERGLGAVNGLLADGKLILLDDRGTLLLARPVERGIEIVSRVSLFEDLAWTAPTLVGQTLYVRNRKNIMALDLG